jgi:PhoPQ-activated pathogenicity-related protein
VANAFARCCNLVIALSRRKVVFRAAPTEETRMNAMRPIAAVLLAWLALAPGARPAEPALPKKTPLDDYIAKPDPTYSWKLVKTIPGDGCTTFVVDLKSQSWRKSPEVDRAVWQHWLVIVKPARVKHDTALLLIGGGKNGGAAPEQPGAQLTFLAQGTGAVVAELRQVPNQPLTFDEDGQPRSEDDLIASRWVKYLDTGDPTWLPRLAMVKSAVRAMDAVTEMLAGEQGGKTAIKKFVVAGGSKRGWTTWLTGAVDPRVAAVIPIVIDAVNVRACSTHHFCAYGFWAPALGDYSRHKIYERADTPRYAELLKIEDPWFYRHRLTVPKFIVNAAGDQYFLPDSARFSFDDLPGVKYLRYIPNANHSLKGSDAADSILAFCKGVLAGATLPKFSWKLQEDGSLRVQTDTKPQEINLWQATNPRARDFRLEAIGPAYKKATLPAREGGVCVARVEKPAAGWTAFFVELVFDSGEIIPYKFTTQVYVVPDTLPHSLEELKGKK